MLALALSSCEGSKEKTEQGHTQATDKITDDSLLTLVQYQTFQYFWENEEPTSGLARERTHLDSFYPEDDQNVVTSGGSGFGLMAILVGVERGFISREEAITRYLKILSFLENADSFHGAFPHWWYGASGKVKPFSKKDDGGDLVETAFLIQGLIAVRQYFSADTEEEATIRARINAIWEAVDWEWYTQGTNALYWHWSPQNGWEMNFAVRGYNECLIMYVLAASSLTHPISPEVYHKGWARDGAISSDDQYLGYETVLDHFDEDANVVGPLFWAHYSYLGLDPRRLKDQYADYWKLNVNHALIHYTHCVNNPNDFKGYGKDCWGLTSSYSMNGYAGHRPDQDLSVISPTAALSSFP
ncbi:MAG: glucoamylase family protein, partial [Cyclobacteriaceae bacterium]